MLPSSKMQKVEIRIPLNAIARDDVVGGAVDLSKTSPRLASQVQAFSETKSPQVLISPEVLEALMRVRHSAPQPSINGWRFQPQLVVGTDNVGRAGFTLLGRDIAISGRVDQQTDGVARAVLSYTSSNQGMQSFRGTVSVSQRPQGLIVRAPNGVEHTVPKDLADQITLLVSLL
ncbi:MAG: hypothetical protein AAGE61_04685 [Pseudomonadota bacterium]